MSSSGEVVLQGRPPTSHVDQGVRDTGVYYRTRQTEIQCCPNKDTLPVEPPVTFTLRPEVHIHHDHKPSQLDKRSAGGVPRGQTKMIGKTNKTGWRTPKSTSKTRRAHNRAERWLTKHG